MTTTIMRRLVAGSDDELGRMGADVVAGVLSRRPEATLLVATGNTPMGTYRELAQMRSAGLLDASRARVFQLDEYVGLGPGDRRSLYGWMQRAFVKPLGIPSGQVTRLDAGTDDPGAACRAYDAAVDAAGGIDLAILGLGPNGHLGFNEPPSEADAPTRVIELTEASIESNAGYWGGREQVPARAVTAGMTVILAARQVLLVVAGAHKRNVLRRTVDGDVLPEVPASLLQRAADVTVLADRDAWG